MLSPVTSVIVRSCFFILFAADFVCSQAASNNLPLATGYQAVPTTAQVPDGSFYDASLQPNPDSEQGWPPPEDPSAPIPAVYGLRAVDIPFGRLHQGNLKYFPRGQLNTLTDWEDDWADQGGKDMANQSACGIPDLAFKASKVAIHPYFLKYAPDGLGLSRYCMQDVGISFWALNWTTDMMLKVTDICCTDPNDPSCCATPNDIRVERSKARVWWSGTDPSVGNTPLEQDSRFNGDQFPMQMLWWFQKPWDDALIQPGWGGNWFGQPPLPNFGHTKAPPNNQAQAANNAANYAAHGLPVYPDASYNTQAIPYTIEDWNPGECYDWTPVGGGRGHGDHQGADHGFGPCPPNADANLNSTSQNATSLTPPNTVTTSPIRTNTNSVVASSATATGPQRRGHLSPRRHHHV